jgi:preprotein translocase subunit SecF
MSSKLMKKDFTIVQNFPKLILISLAVILAGVVFMFVTGLNIGIDYEGGAKI